jgi:signal transduction histidine kinase
MGSPRPDAKPDADSDYAAHIRSWERRVPWYRRISGRTGLQGKLVLSFMFLLTVSLGSSCWLFLSESHVVLNRVMGDQARAVAQTLAMAAEQPLAGRDIPELNRVGRDLLRNRDLVAVAFYGPEGELLALASNDAHLDSAPPELLPNPKDQTGELLQANRRSVRFGSYLQVTAPVTTNRPFEGFFFSPNMGRAGPTRLAGYVTLCFSQVSDEQALGRVTQLLILIGGVAALVSLPLVYGLIHRIFHPIRQLVSATDRIAAGDLDAQVAVYRPDVIGTLARSFNEMVKRVRSQQQELANSNTALAATNLQLVDANSRLEEANDQLELANEDLEKKIHQRTAQLETANKRLRSEIAEKEDFLRAVSHDLNAPLRNIAGMATMLLHKHRDKFEDDIIHRLERIQKNVQVETDLIAELLELSRIKTRRQKLEAVDLDALVRDFSGVFEHDLKKSDIRLVIDGKLPVLHCERARLRQVFQNLIDNAIKYMGDGGAGGGSARVKEIHVGGTVRADETEFYVRDTGIGIDPEDLDKVFYVFRRGKNAASQNVAGKGVGLASVKSIVETYNGSIWVESQVGHGSTFRFTINGQFVIQPGTPGVAPAVVAAAGGPPREQGKAA